MIKRCIFLYIVYDDCQVGSQFTKFRLLNALVSLASAFADRRPTKPSTGQLFVCHLLNMPKDIAEAWCVHGAPDSTHWEAVLWGLLDHRKRVVGASAVRRSNSVPGGGV